MSTHTGVSDANSDENHLRDISLSMERKTYLITGSTGFLGQALSASLISMGHSVRIPGQIKNNLTGSSGERRLRMNASVEEWSETIEGCSGIFHLAWSTVPSVANADPLADVQTNLIGTVRMLEALRKSSTNIPLIFTSSGGTVYGVAEKLPIPEYHPLRPLTAYGASKVAAEQYALLYRRMWNVDARIVRLSNPFGPGQNVKGQLGAASIFAARALNRQKIEIWGDGAVIRDYIYVDDAVSGFLAIMNSPKNKFDGMDSIVNIGSGHGVSLREVINSLGHILGRAVEVEFKPARGFDVPSNVLDISLAYNLLGWKPTVGFEEGLSRYVAYLKGQLPDG